MSARPLDSSGDAGRVDHLLRLAGAVLAQVGVGFTRRALRATVEREYALTLRGGTVFAQVSRRLLAVDRREPTNGLIVLCRVLRRYHVRNVVGETPAATAGVHVIARARDDGGDWREALAFQVAAPRPDPTITAFVFFHANEFSGEEAAGKNVSRPIGQALVALGVVVVGAGVLAAVGLAVTNPAFGLNAGLAFALAGLIISGWLVAYELDSRILAWSRPGCEHGRLRLSCAAVMQSRAAKLGGVVSLADLGVVYFGALVALLLAAASFDHAPAVQGTLCWLAWAPLPFSLFALGYQLFALRAWCSFCLAVHGVLWGHAIWAGRTWSATPAATLEIAAVATWTIAAGGIGVMLFLLRRGSRLARRLREQELQHAHWTRDGELFLHLFRAPAAFAPPPLGAPRLGDAGARLKIVAVLSPHCVPCADMLKKLRRLVDWFNGDLAVNIVVTDGPLQQAVLRLTAAQRNDEAIAVLRSWYEVGREAEIARVEGAAAHVDLKLLRHTHAEWLRRHRIVATPTLIFNGRLIPDDYYDLTLWGEMAEEHWPVAEPVAPVPASCPAPA